VSKIIEFVPDDEAAVCRERSPKAPPLLPWIEMSNSDNEPVP
jgi:hypothetical protein